MDSLTQICLGAAVGEAYLGKKVGNKAILWGAILGTVPDLDVLFKPFYPFVEGLVMHRGLSHSLIFFVLSSPIFGWFIHKIHPRTASVKKWAWFSFWVMFTHAILDCFTSWGTQLFWPLPLRVAWNNIFVADLAYTLPLLICLIWLMFKRKDSATRRRLNHIGLTLSSFYMIFTFVNKTAAGSVFKSSLKENNISYGDFSTRPTPLNTILWNAVAEGDDYFYSAYYSLLADDHSIHWDSIPKNHDLLNAHSDNEDWKDLILFSGGEYALEKTESDTILIHDLRFGKMQFPDGTTDFVFTFYGVPSEENNTLDFSQKPLPNEKLSSEDIKQVFSGLWETIKGNKLPPS
tara:strand:+ start:14585 stop:15625 length:1041 start_codon:yes stop_codon:yes gene_type:complete